MEPLQSWPMVPPDQQLYVSSDRTFNEAISLPRDWSRVASTQAHRKPVNVDPELGRAVLVLGHLADPVLQIRRKVDVWIPDGSRDGWLRLHYLSCPLDT